MTSLYNNTVNETSHQYLLKYAKCDHCGKPATRWFGSTSVRICNNSECREHYQAEWDEMSRQQALEDEDRDFRY